MKLAWEAVKERQAGTMSGGVYSIHLNCLGLQLLSLDPEYLPQFAPPADLPSPAAHRALSTRTQPTLAQKKPAPTRLVLLFVLIYDQVMIPFFNGPKAQSTGI